jgi:Demerecviridae HNH endonuclease
MMKEICELLEYNPETGEFRWSRALSGRNGKARRGAIAGSLHSGGYIEIGIAGQRYFAHRLAWYFVHGVWPRDEIDHINTDKTDNRIANLREATSQQNHWNCGPRRRNASGIKGVYWDKRRQCWQAGIRVSGKNIHLGSFKTKEAAAHARVEAEKKYCGVFGRRFVGCDLCQGSGGLT